MSNSDSPFSSIIEALSKRDEKYLKIEWSEDSFLGREGEYYSALLRFTDPWSSNAFNLPRKLKLRSMEGELENTSNYHWLEVSFPTASIKFFQRFLVDLIEKVEARRSVETVRKVLLDWKKHWRFSNSEFSLEERIGLVGELMFLKSAMENIPDFSWKFWQGSGKISGLHDFVTDDHRIEIKSTTARNGGEIHVFDSKQFYARDNLYLCVIVLDNNPSGDSLEDLCEDVIRMVDESELEEVRGILRPVIKASKKHPDERYSFHSSNFTKVRDEGPFLQSGDISHRSIWNVKYRIWIDDIRFEGGGGIEALLSHLSHA